VKVAVHEAAARDLDDILDWISRSSVVARISDATPEANVAPTGFRG
jgi:hypothetical protein